MASRSHPGRRLAPHRGVLLGHLSLLRFPGLRLPPTLSANAGSDLQPKTLYRSFASLRMTSWGLGDGFRGSKPAESTRQNVAGLRVAEASARTGSNGAGSWTQTVILSIAKNLFCVRWQRRRRCSRRRLTPLVPPPGRRREFASKSGSKGASASRSPRLRRLAHRVGFIGAPNLVTIL